MRVHRPSKQLIQEKKLIECAEHETLIFTPVPIIEFVTPLLSVLFLAESYNLKLCTIPFYYFTSSLI